MINYEVVIGEEALAQIKQYKSDLEKGNRQPGKRLAKRLEDKKLSDMLDEDLVKELIATRNNIADLKKASLDKGGAEWNDAEQTILQSIVIKVPEVTIFDNGSQRNPQKPASPFKGTLFFIPNLLTHGNLVQSSTDWHKIFDTAGQLDQRAFHNICRARLLPVFSEINDLAKANSKKAIVTIPDLFRNEQIDLSKALQDVLEELLTENSQYLPNIGLVYYSPVGGECGNFATTISGTDIVFRVRPRGLEASLAKALLEYPAAYNEMPDDNFAGYELYNLTASDPTFWIAVSDLHERNSDTACILAATNVMSQLTGFQGKYKNGRFNLAGKLGSTNTWATALPKEEVPAWVGQVIVRTQAGRLQMVGSRFDEAPALPSSAIRAGEFISPESSPAAEGAGAVVATEQAQDTSDASFVSAVEDNTSAEVNTSKENDNHQAANSEQAQGTNQAQAGNELLTPVGESRSETSTLVAGIAVPQIPEEVGSESTSTAGDTPTEEVDTAASSSEDVRPASTMVLLVGDSLSLASEAGSEKAVEPIFIQTNRENRTMKAPSNNVEPETLPQTADDSDNESRDDFDHEEEYDHEEPSSDNISDNDFEESAAQSGAQALTPESQQAMELIKAYEHIYSYLREERFLSSIRSNWPFGKKLTIEAIEDHIDAKNGDCRSAEAWEAAKAAYNAHLKADIKQESREVAAFKEKYKRLREEKSFANLRSKWGEKFLEGMPDWVALHIIKMHAAKENTRTHQAWESVKTAPVISEQAPIPTTASYQRDGGQELGLMVSSQPQHEVPQIG